MAVYTDLTDEDLHALLATYDLGAPLAFKGVAEGVENSNFMLETETGRFFSRSMKSGFAPKTCRSFSTC